MTPLRSGWRWLLGALLAGVGIVVGARHLLREHAKSTSASEAQATFRPRSYPEPLVAIEELDVDVAVSENEADSALTEFKPRDDRPVWQLTRPVDWAADPFNDRNWQFQLHSLGMNRPLLGRYAATADSARYRQALTFTLDWWSFHRAREKPPAYSWYDMAVGKRAAMLAFLLDRVFAGREKPIDADLTALLEMAGAHVARLRDPKFIVMTNHGLFQIQGLAVLCRVLGEVGPCRGADAYAQEHLSKLLDKQFDEFGVHREHSPQYHHFVMEALQRMRRPNGTGIYKQIDERLQLAATVLPWLVFPDRRLAALGDSEGEVPPLAPPPQRKCPDDEREPCTEVGDFSRSGYVVVRSPWSWPTDDAFMLIMTGMYNSRTHKHVDDLSFELMEHGELLFQDSGKYAYLRDRTSKFIHAARAHSTVGLADRELLLEDTKPYGSALLPPQLESGVHSLRGSVERKKLFKQTRRIDYAPGRYLLIDDTLTSSHVRSYESYLHLAPQLQPKRDGNAFVVALRNGRSMRIESLSADCIASEARGQSEPMQGWVTKGYREMIPASALTFGCSGKKRHITLLVSFDAAARAEAQSRAAALRETSN